MSPTRLAAGRSAVLVDGRRRSPTLAGVAVIRADDPRRALALMAARFYPRQPEQLVAVTGTSGKTSVAAFARQIFAAAGHEAASVGTHRDRQPALEHLWQPDDARPDRAPRHARPAGSARASPTPRSRPRATGSTSAGSTASASRRPASPISAATTWTITPTVADYLAAKLRLFTAILPAGGTAVVDMDGAAAAAVVAAAKTRGQRLVRIGRRGSELPHRRHRRRAASVSASASMPSAGPSDVVLPLAGAFQASNALVAAGLAIGAGIATDAAIAALARLEGAPGRLELVGHKSNGAMIFIDYAHKPDALVSALSALRPMTHGQARRRLRRRRRPRSGQAAADGQGRRRARRRRHRHRRQSALGGSGGNPPRRSSTARRRRSRSATAAEAIRRAIAMLEAGRCALHRRQGPRDRADRRRRGHPVLGPPRGRATSLAAEEAA